MGITGPELDILDAFEDVEYERRDVEVALVVSFIFPFQLTACCTLFCRDKYCCKAAQEMLFF